MSVKSSIVRCLSNAVVKVPRNYSERTPNLAVIKHFRNGSFENKNYHKSGGSHFYPIVLL